MREIPFHLRRLIYEKIWLKRMDDRSVRDDQEEIRLFMVVRNEALRLPYVIQHYRKMGVTRFFVVDNGSSDSTREFLLAQPDIHVFYTQQSFASKPRWLEALLERYGKYHWCLVVDADEIFLYPHYEQISLREFCDFLARDHRTALHNILVDMYPKQLLQTDRYKAGDDLVQKCPYFDAYDYFLITERRRNHKTLRAFYPEEYYGGTRRRLFGIGVACSKISLIHYDHQTFLSDGMHCADGVRFSDLQGVVLHFKFLFDFYSRVKEEVTREQMFNKAATYKAYAKTIEKGNVLGLYYENSIRYESSDQLIQLGFMRTSTDFEDFVVQAKNNSKPSDSWR